MPLTLKPPVIKEFRLEETDKNYGVAGNEPTTVSVRQATQSAHELRNNTLSFFTRKLDPNDPAIELSQKFSMEDVKRKEVFLTLCDCNIMDEQGNMLFTFDNGYLRSEILFNNAWGKLPPSVANEIHSKVLEVNIDWKTGLGE